MKTKKIIYKWNKRKFLKNMFHLLAYILINGIFAINILYLFGIDIIL
jgi:hypothetical protein